MTRAAACSDNPLLSSSSQIHDITAVLALGVADELSLVGLADISAPFSKAVLEDFEPWLSWPLGY